MSKLRDRVAAVTGASSGIGRATAVELARRGAHVALLARTVAALEEVAAEVRQLGRQALVVPTDVTDADACRQAIDATVGTFGRLDVLVCSAGVSMRSFFEDTTFPAIESVMRVNFYGTLFPTRAAIPHVRATRGSLVAVSSLVGKRGTPTYSIYGASKSAVQGLYDSLRLELHAAGVHVGVFSPGHVGTPLREKVLGPTGQPWSTPPPVPFRVWPVQLCAERIVGMIERRRPEVLLPGFVRWLLALDRILGPWLGDRIIRRQFARAPLPDQP
ncbi:MAG: SDR family oxidoreductase [Gemmataceae bacterium]